MADENDLIQDQDAAFEHLFAEDRPTEPDAGLMVRDEQPSLAPEPERAPAPAPEAVPIEDRVRQVVDDRIAREQAERRAMAAERQLAERRQQEQRQDPDFFADPNAFIRAQVAAGITPVQQQFHAALMYNARLTANAIHTEDQVRTAEKAFNDAAAAGTLDRSEWDRIQRSPNPYHEAVLWSRRQAALREVGDDPAAYRQRILDEALKDPQFLARASAAAGGRPLAPVATPATPTAAPQRRPAMPSISAVGNVATAAAATRDIDPDDAFGALVPD